ncbi:zinc finger-containing ubiquitin peptidase 1-like [Patiria miniata]|uniref:C2H2-type domain-containing protein n=1 Tax=Patiria miniata TaxID=46514 RepID=A0A914BPT0_PATMI|nr:zinc finger-containing ubiquitin peptidase 1-like [Patiria miniata]XP_038077961.1 zinc finger-containing ubiquitin peptidase 1-like [Patiria miniata]
MASTLQGFNCEICGQECLTEGNLRTHMLLDHEENAGSCPMCDLRHLTLEELHLHVNTAHSTVLSPGRLGQEDSASSLVQKASSLVDHCPNSNGSSESVDYELKMRKFDPNESMEGCQNSEEERCESSFTIAGASQAVDRRKLPADSEVTKTTSDPSTRRDGEKVKSRPCACSFGLSENMETDGKGSSESSCSNEQCLLNGYANSNCCDTVGKPSRMEDSCADSESEPPNQGKILERKRSRSKAQLSSSSASSSAADVSSTAGDSTDRSSLSSQTSTASPFKKLLRIFSPSKSTRKKVVKDTGASGVSSMKETDDQNLDQDNDISDPECPFCDISGLDPDAMMRHIESKHSNFLASPCVEKQPAQNGNQWNTSMIQKPKIPKPTLLSLSKQAQNLDTVITCPICGLGSFDPDFLTVHVNTEHAISDDSRDQLATAPSPFDDEAGPSTSASSNPQQSVCPVCGMGGLNPTSLNDHVEGHFEVKGQESVSSDRQLAKKLAEEERQLQERQQRETFKQLQAKYGMDEVGSHKQQSEQDLEKAVTRGQITVSDYNQRKTSLKRSLAVGVDDGKSRTSGLIQKMVTYYTDQTTPGLSYVRLCSDTDHYSSTYGDKGWGCGYRNLHMLLSSLVRIDEYRQVLFSGQNAIPSISKLQQLIEAAWAKGFDPQGREQLGGRVANTRKWIGATEITAVLSSLRAKCRLVDFHTPTGRGGTHPLMFEWVRDYFGKPGAAALKLRVLGNNATRRESIQTRKTPLYLQHEGHSRTIIGCEVHKDSSIRLLLFDPSYKVIDGQGLGSAKLDAYAMRPIRKSLTQMKAKQYQIVSVDRLMTSDQEYEQSKVLRSERKP